MKLGAAGFLARSLSLIIVKAAAITIAAAKPPSISFPKSLKSVAVS
jgi:hypothetical protein